MKATLVEIAFTFKIATYHFKVFGLKDKTKMPIMFTMSSFEDKFINSSAKKRMQLNGNWLYHVNINYNYWSVYIVCAPLISETLTYVVPTSEVQIPFYSHCILLIITS